MIAIDRSQCPWFHLQGRRAQSVCFCCLYFWRQAKLIDRCIPWGNTRVSSMVRPPGAGALWMSTTPQRNEEPQWSHGIRRSRSECSKIKERLKYRTLYDLRENISKSDRITKSTKKGRLHEKISRTTWFAGSYQVETTVLHQQQLLPTLGFHGNFMLQNHVVNTILRNDTCLPYNRRQRGKNVNGRRGVTFLNGVTGYTLWCLSNRLHRSNSKMRNQLAPASNLFLDVQPCFKFVQFWLSQWLHKKG